MDHHLTIIDRGLGHIHRWQAVCCCGWHGANRRRQGDANRLYRRHVESEVSARRRPRRPVVPRPPTPAAQLPEPLR